MAVKKRKNRLELLKADVRQAFGDYRCSEGCSCCEDTGEHAKAAERLAKLLDVPPYDDDSGFNFGKFATPD